MHRSASVRFLAAIVAAWLAIVLAEPAALHTCAAHGSAASASTTGEHGAHAGHGGHAHEAGAPTGSDAPESHQCSCVGHCASGSVAALAPADPAIGATILLASTGGSIRDPRFTPVAADFVLPFANGPPLRRPRTA